MKILVIRFSSLGDIVLTSSMLAWLKLKYPNVTLDFATSSEFSSLVKNHKFVDEVLLFDRKTSRGFFGLWNFSKSIRQNKYDLIIDLHGTTRATLLRFLCFSTPFLIIEKRRLLRFLLVKLKINLMDTRPHLKRILSDFGKIIGFDGRFDKITHFLERSAVDAKPYLSSTPWTFQKSSQDRNKKIIIFAPVASFETKRWPIEYFQKLAELILTSEEFEDVSIFSLAGPDDSYCSPLNETEERFERFTNLQGKTSLNESAEYLKKATLCIGNDTGLPHIAESFGVPSIVLFGPTVKEFGFGPHLSNSVVMEEDVFCRPCSGTGARPCFRDKRYCMLDITPEKVFDKLKERWREVL